MAAHISAGISFAEIFDTTLVCGWFADVFRLLPGLFMIVGNSFFS